MLVFLGNLRDSWSALCCARGTVKSPVSPCQSFLPRVMSCLAPRVIFPAYLMQHTLTASFLGRYMHIHAFFPPLLSLPFPHISAESKMLCLAISSHEEFWIFILWEEEESTQSEGRGDEIYVCTALVQGWERRLPACPWCGRCSLPAVAQKGLPWLVLPWVGTWLPGITIPLHDSQRLWWSPSGGIWLLLVVSAAVEPKKPLGR